MPFLVKSTGIWQLNNISIFYSIPFSYLSKSKFITYSSLSILTLEKYGSCI